MPGQRHGGSPPGAPGKFCGNKASVSSSRAFPLGRIPSPPPPSPKSEVRSTPEPVPPWGVYLGRRTSDSPVRGQESVPSPCFFSSFFSFLNCGFCFLKVLPQKLVWQVLGVFCVGGTVQTKLLIREAASRQTCGGSCAEPISCVLQGRAHMGGEPRQGTELKSTAKGA